jgi:hypothetical protein
MPDCAAAVRAKAGIYFRFAVFDFAAGQSAV